MYRYKKSVGGSYARQGYIYFTSLRYRELPEWKQRAIRELCGRAGEEYREALLEYVTTETEPEIICWKHHLSKSTLHRITRRYYREFPRDL